uniref:Serine aminopeptidase S33 domain-containing protein n=1 Tax=Pinguiococcus pyrenoidosus TaxID=172671 RepID=A0A7R9YFC4_9STRA|mmetsp:Transcript_7997/g.29919  ORF Transcript_7997/g.29919 Transcript_7997/m.29919 type:complete len:321 (+) Transcript_7997:597-1559(+)
MKAPSAQSIPRNAGPEDLYPRSGAKTSFFTNRKGLKLAVHTWAVRRPRAIVVVAHGIDAHARFQFGHPSDGDVLYADSWAEFFNRRDIQVVGVDHQSHGASEGIRPGLQVFFESFTDIVDDLEDVLRKVQDEAAGIPVILLGASFGGCVAAHVAARRGSRLHGTVLLCPMLSVEGIKKQPLNRILLPLVDYLSRWFPTMAIGSKAESTTFPELHRNLQMDPLTYDGPFRARTASENLRAMDEAMDQAELVQAPILMVHSYADTMCEPEGSQKFLSFVSSRDKTIDLLDDVDGYKFWHALTHEPGNKIIAERVCRWIERRV